MSSMFGGGAKPAAPTIIQQAAPTPAPTPTAPAVMPDQNSPDVVAARQKALQDASTRTGRASTMLSGDGSGDYKTGLLGQ